MGVNQYWDLSIGIWQFKVSGFICINTMHSDYAPMFLMSDGQTETFMCIKLGCRWACWQMDNFILPFYGFLSICIMLCVLCYVFIHWINKDYLKNIIIIKEDLAWSNDIHGMRFYRVLYRSTMLSIARHNMLCKTQPILLLLGHTNTLVWTERIGHRAKCLVFALANVALWGWGE